MLDEQSVITLPPPPPFFLYFIANTTLENLPNHALRDCFKPYKGFLKKKFAHLGSTKSFAKTQKNFHKDLFL